ARPGEAPALGVAFTLTPVAADAHMYGPCPTLAQWCRRRARIIHRQAGGSFRTTRGNHSHAAISPQLSRRRVAAPLARGRSLSRRARASAHRVGRSATLGPISIAAP